MFQKVVAMAALCGLVHSSGIHHGALADAPIVTASSSQYFERTFNRLVASPVLPPQQFIPVQQVPVAPIPFQPVPSLPVPTPHFQPVPIQPVQTVQPAPPVQPVQPQPVEPNVAIAIATANAAAPVATILLPPYPFGFPFGLIPQEQPTEDKTKEESTTQKPTSPADVITTKQPEATTLQPEGSDNNVQGSPSNQDQSRVNFRQYLAPPIPSNQNVNFNPNNVLPSPLPSNQDINFRKYLGPKQPQKPQYQPLANPHHHHHHTHIHVHPKKLKTIVEVQKVPLAYIAPPPLPHFEHNRQAVKVVKHVYSVVPSKTKLIIRPVVKPHNAMVQNNAGYRPNVGYKPNAGYKLAPPLPLKSLTPRSENPNLFNTKDVEPTTLRPFLLPNNKPPRL